MALIKHFQFCAYNSYADLCVSVVTDYKLCVATLLSRLRMGGRGDSEPPENLQGVVSQRLVLTPTDDASGVWG